MLSAFAARKAARQDLTKALVLSEIVSRPVTPSSVSPSPLKPVSKRKPGFQALHPTKKSKRKKVKHEQPRYFAEEDSFIQQDDVIIIDRDDLDDGDEDEDSSELPSFFENSTTLQGKRAWSPSRPLRDSSDEEVDVNAGDLRVLESSAPARPSRTIAAEDSLLSTFKPSWDNNIFTLSSTEIELLGLSTRHENPAIVLVMTPGETLCLLGTYTFIVTFGSISLAGVTLTSSSRMHHVFAPRCSPVPVLQCLQPNGKTVDPTSTLLPSRLHPFLKSECAVLILQELCTGVEGLGKVCRIFDGIFEPSRWHKNRAVSELGLSGAYAITHRHNDIHPFMLMPSWEKAISDVCFLEEGTTSLVCPIYLVKGPKKTGKSTFARTLLNCLSTRFRKVAFLECDLGQSEFTPSGMVALNIIEQPLFGPPFTHPAIPRFAHYIGSTSPRSSPSHYLSAIQALVQSFRLDIQSSIADVKDGDHRIAGVVPLVVNTMGWAKGLGADLTRQIENMVEPTDVFEIETPAFEQAWRAAAPPYYDNHPVQSNPRYHTLESIPMLNLRNSYSPADYRTLSVLSYFHAVFPSELQNLHKIPTISWATELPLCAQTPYQVNWAQALDKVFLTGAGMEDVVPSEIERVLNGAIVGLVSYEPTTIDMDDEPSSTIPYIQGVLPVSPSASTCYGLALIRAVSPSSTYIHVLTPLPSHFLAKCRVLVKGELELPVWGMLDFRPDGGDGGIAGIEKSKVPYLQWGKGEGVGADRRRIRRNLMRRGQM